VLLLAAVELMEEQACSMSQESSTHFRYPNIYEKYMPKHVKLWRVINEETVNRYIFNLLFSCAVR